MIVFALGWNLNLMSFWWISCSDVCNVFLASKITYERNCLQFVYYELCSSSNCSFSARLHFKALQSGTEKSGEHLQWEEVLKLIKVQDDLRL